MNSTGTPPTRQKGATMADTILMESIKYGVFGFVALVILAYIYHRFDRRANP